MTRETRNRETPAATAPGTSTLFETVARWLDSNDWNYEDSSEQGWFSARYRGDSGSWRIILDTFEDADVRRLIVYSIYPVFVPEARRLAVSEMITRANSRMVLGNFELDFSDGEVRYKTAVDVCHGEMSAEIIERLLHTNIGTANRYLAVLLGVAFGNVAPAAAIEQAERPPQETLQ